MRLSSGAAREGNPGPRLSGAQTAHLLGISRMTVIRKADTGELPCVVVNRGKQRKMRRFPRQFIEDMALGRHPGISSLDPAAGRRAEL
jgi:helix-turn-helix protein